ncbi:MAG TPA: hypothetical protein VF041_03230 [Gemmatimonadaceae bacterium]
MRPGLTRGIAWRCTRTPGADTLWPGARGIRDDAVHPIGSEAAVLTVAASDVLGDSLPPGRYFFTMHVFVRGQKTLELDVAAGDAELRRDR